jgi:hypothetical protein
MGAFAAFGWSPSMTRLPIVLTMLIGSFSLATAAQAAADDNANDPNAADVRCVVVSIGLLQSPDPRVKALATGASLYFVGRIRGHSPDLDLEAAIVKQYGTMTPEDMRDELQRCGGVLQDEGGKLKVIGEDLKNRAAAQAAPDSAPK